MSKFEKGQSGNPKGRTPAHITATKVRKSLADDLPDILNKLVELAKEGDTTAIKLILDRVCPALKPQAVPISLSVCDSLAGQGQEVIRATMQGQIPPDIGSQLITALANQAKIIEIDELTKRIELLEQANEH
ncbi:MAG: DUF5681 domain-containing protein [Methylococcales bacterium]